MGQKRLLRPKQLLHINIFCLLFGSQLQNVCTQQIFRTRQKHTCATGQHTEREKNDRKMRLRNSCVRFSVKNAKWKIITKPNTRSNQLIDGLIVHWTAVFIGECDRK